MPLDLDTLIDCFDLDELNTGEYEGRNYPLRYPRVFGGQLLGQALRALQRSDGDKAVKSFHCVFAAEGDPSVPMRYRVDTVRAGRSFTTCTVAAVQAGRTVAVVSGSLHAGEDGLDRQVPAPEVAGPHGAPGIDLGVVPWDVRVVEGGDLADPTPRAPVFRYWMRADERTKDPGLAQALLAHACESSVIGTAMLPVEGFSQADAHVRYTSAVTSHSMWFHSPFGLDEWLLVDQSSPVLRGARAFGCADVWTEDGRLVATFAQEALVRLRAD